uniref:SURP motif domain-containing protein n=1 Tax=Nelumbo nucifera TaxID=4432 RepID=A0A822YVC8_NELNU|nr:TPA_asm: hypothetical protein HUJ06_005705 [Nelumbo nucifera]
MCIFHYQFLHLQFHLLRGPSHPEMTRGPPPRVLPSPPSQGQVPYRTLCLPLSGTQGPQNIQSLPPPPLSSYVPVTPASFASFGHSPFEDAHPPSIPPPPPLPPSLSQSPPPSSSPSHSARCSEASSTMSLGAGSNLVHHTESGSNSDKRSDSSEVLVNNSVDHIMGPAQTSGDMPTHNNAPNGEGATSGKIGSMVEDGLSYKEQSTLELPPAPPKPSEEVVQKIEDLCYFIAKNGPQFEDVVHKNESGNPEFAFLFGGDCGSEAAIAHDYFQ